VSIGSTRTTLPVIVPPCPSGLEPFLKV
jgi:hypothetical protein